MKLEPTKARSLPDFHKLYECYQSLGSGPQADLRRVGSLDVVADLPAYYRLLSGREPTVGLQRFAFLLPYIKHMNGVRPGRALRKAGITEMRMFQMLRSHPLRDLEQLRRLCQQAAPLPVDVDRLGRSLRFWSREEKQNILRDYLVIDTDSQNDKPE